MTYIATRRSMATHGLRWYTHLWTCGHVFVIGTCTGYKGKSVEVMCNTSQQVRECPWCNIVYTPWRLVHYNLQGRGMAKKYGVLVLHIVKNDWNNYMYVFASLLYVTSACTWYMYNNVSAKCMYMYVHVSRYTVLGYNIIVHLTSDEWNNTREWT